MKPKIIIVGAGLSGLLMSYLLQKRFAITILEARDRTGGRIHCTQSDGKRFDLGPTWVWPHQRHILDLADYLGLTLFRHFDNGAFAYDAPNGVEYYQTQRPTPSFRFENGAMALIDGLQQRLGDSEIRLGSAVKKICHDTKGVTVETDGETFDASACIVTLPPRLCADRIAFEPPLPSELKAKMLSMPTWMGFSAKCVVTYPKPFWREQGLSGFASSHIGPLSEIHDASAATEAALFGFYHTKSADTAAPKEVIEQLVRLFGEAAHAYSGFHYHNWRQDPYTSIAADAAPLTEHPRYGPSTPVGDRLFLCGTETAEQEGGYLEGAVIAAKRLAALLMSPEAHLQ